MDKVCCLASLQGCRFRVRRGIDDGVISPVRSGGCQDLVQGRSLRGDDDRILLAPAVVPGFRAGLRIEVDDDCILPCGFRRTREVDRQRGFASAALLGEDRNCFHAYRISRTHDYMVAGRRGVLDGDCPAARLPRLEPKSSDGCKRDLDEGVRRRLRAGSGNAHVDLGWKPANVNRTPPGPARGQVTGSSASRTGTSRKATPRCCGRVSFSAALVFDG